MGNLLLNTALKTTAPVQRGLKCPGPRQVDRIDPQDVTEYIETTNITQVTDNANRTATWR